MQQSTPMPRIEQRPKKTSRAQKSQAVTKALEVALYYGFSPQPPPTISRNDIELSRKSLQSEPRWVPAGEDGTSFLCESVEEKVAIMRTYRDRGMAAWPQPVMLAFDGPIRGARGDKQSTRDFHFHLEIIGTSKSIAEAILAKASYDILREEGFNDLYIDINTVGDKDSAARHARELTAYYKRRMAELSPACREAVKNNPFDIVCEDPECKPIHDTAPQSLSYLTEPSRQHFREVLEYLESTNLPYRINPTLCGDRSIATHTVFEIKSISNEKEALGNQARALAFGVRYNNLAKRMGERKDIPAIGVSIIFKKTDGHGKRSTVILKRPKIFFIQLGFEAKLKSLGIIEILRKAKIPVMQALPKDKLNAQLTSAEELGIPYTLIFGQKEALEGTVIIRDMSNRSQNTVPIANLPTFLRKVG